MSNNCVKFHVVAFGLAWGILAAVVGFILGLLAMVGYGSDYVNFVGGLYIGYKATVVGSIVGAIWSFVHGFVFGAVFAWLYNHFGDKCHKE